MSDVAAVRLLVWDEPDVRARQREVLVADAPPDSAVELEAVYLWFAERCGPQEQPEACLFTTVAPGQEAATAPAITAAREQGFAVHVRRPPSSADPTPLRDAMASMIQTFERSGPLRELVIASHDANGLAARLDALALQSVPVVVLGFRELAAKIVGRPGVQFVDIEDIPGAYRQRLPRTNLFDLPDDGRTLPALRRPRRDSGAGRPAAVTATTPIAAAAPAPAAPAPAAAAPAAPAPAAAAPAAPAPGAAGATPPALAALLAQSGSGEPTASTTMAPTAASAPTVIDLTDAAAGGPTATTDGNGNGNGTEGVAPRRAGLDTGTLSTTRLVPAAPPAPAPAPAAAVAPADAAADGGAAQPERNAPPPAPPAPAMPLPPRPPVPPWQSSPVSATPINPARRPAPPAESPTPGVTPPER